MISSRKSKFEELKQEFVKKKLEKKSKSERKTKSETEKGKTQKYV